MVESRGNRREDDSIYGRNELERQEWVSKGQEQSKNKAI
jgi:hypothetical protein